MKKNIPPLLRRLGSTMGIVFFLSLFVFPGGASAATTFSGADCNLGTIVGDVVFEEGSCNGGLVMGNAIFNGSTTNYGTVQGTTRFNDLSYNYGTIIGDATFDDESYTTGVVKGDATFNTTYYSGSAPSSGVFTIDGDILWDGSISGTVYGSDKLPITDYVFTNGSYNNGTLTGAATFNGTSYNHYGTIIGDATFNDSSHNAGEIKGDATFNTTYYHSSAPSGGMFTISGSSAWQGSVSGTVYGTDGIYVTSYVFNDSSYNTGEIKGSATFNTTYYSGSAPSGGVFTVSDTNVWYGSVSGTTYGADGLPVTSYVFNHGSGAYGTLNGTTTFNGTSGNTAVINGTATFNDSSVNYGIINGNATFNGDMAELVEGSVSGTKTRRYTSSVITARDFVTDGPWSVVVEGRTVVVNVANAAYDSSTQFITLKGGVFSRASQ